MDMSVIVRLRLDADSANWHVHCIDCKVQLGAGASFRHIRREMSSVSISLLLPFAFLMRVDL